ncbi:hypothetical protein CS0771_68770 [Catellatospora sp. IY07-71]|nr:hypothetical protein CS0771_68770 [Catellatospora sp. IY07-71]
MLPSSRDEVTLRTAGRRYPVHDLYLYRPPVRAYRAHRGSPAGAEVQYLLTPAGRELEPIVVALGAWGVRWIGELGDQDLDPKLLLWDMHRHVDPGAVPERRTVVRFSFHDRCAARRSCAARCRRGSGRVSSPRCRASGARTPPSSPPEPVADGARPAGQPLRRPTTSGM